ncbi:EAL domain-containing protein [Paracoccus caeni]|uniref:EAL domain-containing protein n=1 Tax=Paracoccus caeni TaxID=657651 RepID=A0A934VYN2_9RHOB|nr:GGDEF domain-containing phosphodiesterase [Paracoccus caeni]MBK4214935.1 EAL domain-containing protein [Paracoccus caeni]
MQRKLTDSMKRLWARLQHGGDDRVKPVSLVVLRLENLADLAGHLGKIGTGQLLVNLCVRLAAVVRPEDMVQMLAPGIFGIILPDRDEAEAVRIARRLHEVGQRRVSAGGSVVTPVLTALVMHPPVTTGAARSSSTPLPDLVTTARNHLDRLRPEELGTVLIHDFSRVLPSSQLPETISAAVTADQIVAYFQPQISCHTGEVTGFEALARWNHPTRGILSPAAFMDRMTENDHRVLTMSMLGQSLRALKSWDASGWTVPTVSVNVSQFELADADFATSLLWELDRHDIAPPRLVLEMLETIGPLGQDSHARTNLITLAAAGCLLDLDDFGTGYSGFDAIRQYGVQRIKIDRSFVAGCDADPGQQRMVLAILAMSEKLGIAALAEGVETREEHSFLAQIGCDETQGYIISRPMPLEATFDFLAHHAEGRDSLPLFGRKTA